MRLNPYSVIIARLNGDDIKEPSYRRHILSLAQKGIGGFIIFGGEKEPLRAFIKKLSAWGTLFIASDIERGVGQQIKGYTLMPCQMAQAAVFKSGGRELIRRLAVAISKEALHAGINMPLIPVLDVNSNPSNPIISTRAFSDDPALVAEIGNIYIEVLNSFGLISCPKHFPGHGDTEIDSHISLPVILKSKKELIKTDIYPFKEAIRAGTCAIMAGHLLTRCIDEMPASVSKKALTGLLRKTMGFNGLILTDALNMGALKDLGSPEVLALKAGADVILHPDDVESSVKAISNALNSGQLEEDQIALAVGRIKRAKRRLLRLKRARFNLSAHKTLSERITEMSITCIKERPGLFPIKDMKVIFVGDNNLYKDSPFKRFTGRNADVTVFAVFSGVSAWRGTSGISKEQIERTKGLIRKTKNPVVVSFGSPYVLSYFQEADALIAAYEATEQAQRAVMKCLFGNAPFKGVLPVRIS